jgi:hypothetical protein
MKTGFVVVVLTVIKLLSQINGNSVNDGSFIISVRGGPCDCSS